MNLVMIFNKECSNKKYRNSNHNYKILNLFYDYWELCHLEYLKKNNNFFTIYISI